MSSFYATVNFFKRFCSNRVSYEIVELNERLGKLNVIILFEKMTKKESSYMYFKFPSYQGQLKSQQILVSKHELAFSPFLSKQTGDDQHILAFCP